MAQVYFLASDNLVEVSGVLDSRTGQLISDASVTATVLLKGVVISGPVICLAVSGSPGLYRGAIPFDAPLASAKTYTLKVYIDGGAGRRRTIQDSVIPKDGP